MNIEEYYRKYPWQTVRLSKGDFTYRYYKNPDSGSTVVLLTGGIGFSDLFHVHFEEFTKYFSVITFDYQIQYKTMAGLADAAAELLGKFGIKAWFAGQSLGGVMAQIIAKYHPEVTEGIILSNTCSLSADMKPEARALLMKMLKGQRMFKKILKIMPFGMYKSMTGLMFRRMAPKGNDVIDEICELVPRLMNRPYEEHMIDFLLDAENYDGMTKTDFARYGGRVLLFLSDDDTTFSGPVRESLEDVMPEHETVTHIRGGHLAIVLNMDEYVRCVKDFIMKHGAQV